LNRLLARAFDLSVFSPSPTSIIFQKGIQRLLGGPRSTEIVFRAGVIEGMRFQCMTSEKYFFEREHFESRLQQILTGLVSSDSVVYEIGAHIGFWALFFSRLAHEVVALEPSPENWGRLKDNVALNKLRNVVCLNRAASEKSGWLRFSENGSRSRVDHEGPLKVPTVRLDDLIPQYGRPSLLVLDVEGHAGAVLRGAPRALERHPNVVCEIHSPVEREDVLDYLGTFGYEIRNLTRRQRFPLHVIGSHPASICD
jgi:FkbM family methyltransferase